MGNCPPQKEPGSVINLSESCVERLTREEKESGRKSNAEEFNIPENISEKDWMIKLKCLDDAHSNEYGLNQQTFDKLVAAVEEQIQLSDMISNHCNGDEIIKCLKKNPNCMIKCRSLMNKYVDCVDTSRINIIKERIESELKEKRKEDQDIVQQFLKNEAEEKS